jgi:hypothetical protein
MSASSRYGYAARISGIVRPLATKPTIVPTVMRRPRTHGLPPIASGSSVILVKGVTAVLPCHDVAAVGVDFACWSGATAHGGPTSVRVGVRLCSKLCSNRVKKPRVGTRRDRTAIGGFSAEIANLPNS